MRIRTFLRVLSPVAISVLAGCEYGAAGVPGPVSPEIDPPGRVARLSYIAGEVSFRAAGTDDWVAATLNRPLTSGDELWADRNARAELDLGHAFVRLDSETHAAILTLTDDLVQIKLTGGLIQVSLRRLDEEDHFEIDTPQAAISLLRTGEYRFGVNPDGGDTEAIVRAGEAEVSAPGQAFSVHAAQRALIGGAETITYQITPAPATDGLDMFAANRDRRADRAESLRYVSPYAIGWEDLDEYGSWMDAAPYGPVWYPRMVDVSWVPYRFGHWVWIEPWGWTWIDDAPWGFAPFHYGRWVRVSARWCWIPGPVRIRAVYAPALVVFAGGGPGFHYYFGIGAGLGVAWFPLGPHEVYVPPYRTSRVYITNINISHTVIADHGNIWKTDPARQRYMNRRADAFTAVNQDVFSGGRPVGREAVRVTREQADSARIGGAAPPVTPSRGSLAPSDQPGRTAPRPPPSAERRPVTVGRTPAPPAVPFEQKRPELDRNPGRPPDGGKVEEMRRSQPPPRQPQYRQVPAPGPQAPTTRPAPQAPAQLPAPRTRPPAPAPAPSARPSQPQSRQPSRGQVENRRKGIEQERKRTEPPASTPQRPPSRPRG